LFADSGPSSIFFDGSAPALILFVRSEETDMAISGLNGKDLKGRSLTVNEARRRQTFRI
jgi:hypothetical protein